MPSVRRRDAHDNGPLLHASHRRTDSAADRGWQPWLGMPALPSVPCAVGAAVQLRATGGHDHQFARGDDGVTTFALCLLCFAGGYLCGLGMRRL